MSEIYSLKSEVKKVFKPTPTTIFFLIPIFILNVYFSFIYTDNLFQQLSLIASGFFLLIVSIQDFNDKEVFGFLLTPIPLSAIFFINIKETDTLFLTLSHIVDNILLGVLLILFIYSLSLLLSVLLRKETMGEGDYPIFFSMAIFLGSEIGIGLLLMSLSAIVYKIILKEEHIPLIPFLYFAIISTLYIKGFVI